MPAPTPDPDKTQTDTGSAASASVGRQSTADAPAAPGAGLGSGAAAKAGASGKDRTPACPTCGGALEPYSGVNPHKVGSLGFCHPCGKRIWPEQRAHKES